MPDQRIEYIPTWNVRTLPDEVGWMVVDVEADYPYTMKEDLLHTPVQKLRRYLDMRWQEAAPFQLHPRLEADRDHPVRVWKHNFLDPMPQSSPNRSRSFACGPCPNRLS